MSTKAGADQRYQSKKWDLYLLTLNYHGQEIDINGAYQTKIFNKVDDKWILLKTDLSKAQKKKIFGIEVRVIPKKELLFYKKTLSRLVDVEDIKEIENNE